MIKPYNPKIWMKVRKKLNIKIKEKKVCYSIFFFRKTKNIAFLWKIKQELFAQEKTLGCFRPSTE